MRRRLIFIFILLAFEPAFMVAKDFPMVEVPGRMKTAEERIDYLASHFWKKFDISKDDADEQAIVDFLTVVSMSSDKSSKRGIQRFYKKFRPSESMLAANEEIIEKYLYDPASPMFNEQLFVRFLQIGNSPRAEFYCEQIYANKVGTIASDFSYLNKEGKIIRLSDNYGKNSLIILIFYDAGCKNCQEVISDYSTNAAIEIFSLMGRIKTVAVDIIAERDEWLEAESAFPEYCESAILADDDFFGDAKFLFRSIPSLYLLDDSGTVLMKDTTIDSIDNYILNHLTLAASAYTCAQQVNR